MISNSSFRFVSSCSILLALLVGLFLSPIGVQSVLAASVCYVNASASGADDGTSWDDAHIDLQSALANGACTEIWVAQGLYRPTSGTDREISFELRSGVALYGGFAGSETTLTQRNPVTHLTTLSGDIGIQDEIADNSYHVIYANGVDVTAVLDGFTITAGNANAISHPYSIGGGMYNIDSHPTVANVTFRNNRAGWSGGGIYNINSNPTLANIIFDGNLAGWNGGGMYNAASSNPTLSNVTFQNNKAEWQGGGIANINSSPELSGVTFSANTASIDGGGMYNEASQPILTNVTFSGNYAIQAGGGMANLDSAPTLTQATFNGNEAGDHGGGMSNDNSSPGLSNVSFKSNQATFWGGGMYNENGSTITLAESTFTQNSAGRGGGIYNSDSSLTLTQVNFNENEASYGGGIYNTGSSLTFTGGAFNRNHAEWDGGGMYNENGGSSALTQTNFDSNSANSGGGIYNTGSSPSLTAITFNKNSAVNAGGGMYNYAGSPRLENVTMSSNTAGNGGGIYNEEASRPTLITIAFNSNSASTSGGGMYNDNSSPTLTGAIFTSNHANSTGGGVHNTSGSSPAFTGGAFNGNAAETNGGGMYNEGGSSPSLADTAFNNNTAESSGGGMYNTGSSPTLTNITFSGNTAKVSGGGMYDTGSSPKLTNVTFSGNSAPAGGGQRNVFGSNPTLTRVTFNNNSANDIGGGMSNDNSNPDLENVTFYNNSALYGGGMHNNNSSPSVANATFKNNSTTGFGSGGGIFNSGSHPTITNVTLNGNSAVSHGGGIYNITSNPVLVNSTISDNSAEYGGGLYMTYSSKPNLKNVILADNPGENCYLYEGSSLNAASAHNLINDISCGLTDGVNGNKIGSGYDAKLTPLADNGGFTQTMALVFGSAAMNTGLDSACPATDQRGVTRPQGAHCDIGAYEYSEVESSAYLPMLFKNAFGGSYNSAFYIQNTSDTEPANTLIEFYNDTGALDCTISASIEKLASPGWWLPSINCLPSNWVGGAYIRSDQPVVAVARPHVGDEVMTYNSFRDGTMQAYLPMLFKKAFDGSYNAAFYVQNIDTAETNITIKFYNESGTKSCELTDTLQPLASKGWWVPGLNCLSNGWVGSAVVTADKKIVAVGRPHIGSEVLTYNGFTSGNATAYLPMLFKNAFGGSYKAAFYIQNAHSSDSANVTIKYYNDTGGLVCTTNNTIAPLASKGYWLPGIDCLPDGWVGGIEVTSSQSIVMIGRPHIGPQITTYNSFANGASKSFVPMLFKNAFGGSYNSAFYIQNINPSINAKVTIKYYDNVGNLACTVTDIIASLGAKGYWLPGVNCLPAGWAGGVVVTSNQPIVTVGRPHIGPQITTYSGFLNP